MEKASNLIQTIRQREMTFRKTAREEGMKKRTLKPKEKKKSSATERIHSIKTPALGGIPGGSVHGWGAEAFSRKIFSLWLNVFDKSLSVCMCENCHYGTEIWWKCKVTWWGSGQSGADRAERRRGNNNNTKNIKISFFLILNIGKQLNNAYNLRVRLYCCFPDSTLAGWRRKRPRKYMRATFRSEKVFPSHE